MKKLPVFLIIGLSSYFISAQRSYITTTGEVHFNASTPLEDIDATNSRVHAVLKEDAGEIAAILLIKDFGFRRKLMQEHFNENYMESDRYPKAYFTGKLLRFSPEQSAPEAGSLKVQGSLTIHGVTNSVETSASMARNGDTIYFTTELLIAPEDYGIRVPKILFRKIAQEVQVAIRFELRQKTGSR